MRKEIKTQAIFLPLPVLMVTTKNEDGSANVMNAAYGTLADFHTVCLFIGDGKKTIRNVERTKAFTVSFCDRNHVADADYVGMTSGNRLAHKLEKTSFEVEDASHVDAPTITNLPLALECELVSYDPKSSQLLGKIRGISCDDRYLREDGSIDVSGMHLLFFNSAENSYHQLGDFVQKSFQKVEESI